MPCCRRPRTAASTDSPSGRPDPRGSAPLARPSGSGPGIGGSVVTLRDTHRLPIMDSIPGRNRDDAGRRRPGQRPVGRNVAVRGAAGHRRVAGDYGQGETPGRIVELSVGGAAVRRCLVPVCRRVLRDQLPAQEAIVAERPRLPGIGSGFPCSVTPPIPRRTARTTEPAYVQATPDSRTAGLQ